MMVIGNPTRLPNPRFHTYSFLKMDNLEVWFDVPDRRYVLWYISPDTTEFSRPIPESIKLRNWMVLAA